jgi:hypothetical protein
MGRGIRLRPTANRSRHSILEMFAIRLRCWGLFLSDQSCDLDEIVVEHAVPAPSPRAVEPVDLRPVPSEVSFEAADAALGSCSPLHELLERSLLLDGAPGGTGFAFGWEHNGLDAEVAQLLVDGTLAIAAVSRHRSGHPRGPGGHTPDGWNEHGGVGRVPHLDVVVDDDAVFVVDDLGLV